MATRKLLCDVKIKYPKLLIAINYPIVFMGFKPWVPSWFVSISKPYTVTGELS